MNVQQEAETDAKRTKVLTSKVVRNRVEKVKLELAELQHESSNRSGNRVSDLDFAAKSAATSVGKELDHRIDVSWRKKRLNAAVARAALNRDAKHVEFDYASMTSVARDLSPADVSIHASRQLHVTEEGAYCVFFSACE